MTLALEERKAWQLYLAHVRAASDYEAVEPWAWVELQRKLLEIERKRPRRKETVKV
jgi:hypothetical protein